MADNARELSSIEQKIDAQVSKFSRQRTINLIVGAVLVIVIFGYMFWLRGMVKEMTEPESLAAWGSTAVRDMLPEMRETLSVELRRELPNKLDETVDEMIKKGIPEARKAAVKFTREAITSNLKEIEGQLLAGLDEAIDAHKGKLKALVADLDSKEGTKAFEDELVATIGELIESDEIRIDLEGYELALKEVNQRLDFYLNTPHDALNSQEQNIYELIVVLREMANRFKLGDVDADDLREAMTDTGY